MGYPTEISPKDTEMFLNEVKIECSRHENVIIEGSSIEPKDAHIFSPDAFFYLYKNVEPLKRLHLCREFDKETD